MPKNNIDPLATTNYIAVSRNMVKKLGCVESVVLIGVVKEKILIMVSILQLKKWKKN